MKAPYSEICHNLASLPTTACGRIINAIQFISAYGKLQSRCQLTFGLPQISAIALICLLCLAGMLLPAQANQCACHHSQLSNEQKDINSLIAQNYQQVTPYPANAQSERLEGGTELGSVQGQISQEGGPVNILILVDSSYSMKEKLSDGGPKMTSAKHVLEDTLSRIPTDIRLGLRVFGQGYSGSPEIDCQQTSLLVPLGVGNRRSIIEQVRQLRPYGLTPLTYALMKAKEDLDFVQGQKTIILISDGAETCGGDPCGFITRLHRLGINIKVNIVGLGLRREKEARNQLGCIAQNSGGKYYDANTAAEMIDSIKNMVTSAISGRVLPKAKQPAATDIAPPVTPPANP